MKNEKNVGRLTSLMKEKRVVLTVVIQKNNERSGYLNPQPGLDTNEQCLLTVTGQSARVELGSHVKLGTMIKQQGHEVQTPLRLSVDIVGDGFGSEVNAIVGKYMRQRPTITVRPLAKAKTRRVRCTPRKSPIAMATMATLARLEN